MLYDLTTIIKAEYFKTLNVSLTAHSRTSIHWKPQKLTTQKSDDFFKGYTLPFYPASEKIPERN